MRALGRLAAIALALGVGCAAAPPPAPAATPATEATAAPGEIPLGSGQARVERVREIGPYLEAHLRGNGGDQGFLFVASGPCRRVLGEGAVVELAPVKPLVRVTSGDGSQCSARGLSGLAAWRDALPARRASFLVVTAPAELALVGAAEGLLLAQGKLPLAIELRWPDPLALAAVLPDTPACRAHLARPRTEMEFRPRGEDALVLRGRLEPCPVLAIAEPVFLQ
jgi:hypothetical protein